MTLHPDVTNTLVIKNYPKIEQEFNKIHNNFYSYENSVIINSKTKINITCPVHGAFWQSPEKHRMGGCSKCGRDLAGSKMRNAAAEEFATKAQKVHNNLYTYSNVVYKNNKTKVSITCSKHGEFLQIPANHLQGDGCPKCVGKNKTTSEFIKEAIEVHGDLYQYDKTVYVASKDKVSITCKLHGEFTQQAQSHLAGVGCPTCAGTQQLTTEEFISRAKDVHGDRFIYTDTQYTKMLGHTDIICRIHGTFTQVPTVHLRGGNCPYCAEIEKQVANSSKDSLVYYIKMKTPNGDDVWKVGMTSDIYNRFSGHLKKSDYEILAQSKLMSRKAAVELEQSILAHYKEYKYNGSMLRSYSSKEFFIKDIYNVNEGIWDGITSTNIPDNS